MKKLTVTVIGDPMMGLLWQTWPTWRKLETHFGKQIHFNILMGQLVRNVYTMVDQTVQTRYGKTVALNQYWTRLMQIYLQEEKIAGMPIYMGGNEPLFDDAHTSSTPLNVAFRVIAGHDEKLEDRVLYELQYDTVVNDLQTTSLKYLTKLAQRFGMNQREFLAKYRSTELEEELSQEQNVIQQAGVTEFPAYLVDYDQKTYVLKGIPRYTEWVKVIDQITNGEIQPEQVEFNLNQLEKLIDHHPHISSLELKAAFDVDDEQQVIDLLKNLKLTKKEIKGKIFYQK